MWDDGCGLWCVSGVGEVKMTILQFKQLTVSFLQIPM